MKKNEFKKFVGKKFKELSPEKRLEILAKMQYQWIPEMREEIGNKYFRCPNCKKYFSTKDLEYIEKNTVEKDVVLEFDAKKENSYTFADVTYRTVLYICPKCKKECVASKKPTAVSNIH